MRLAQISDVHVVDWSEASWTCFLGKRLTGAANFALRRKSSHRREVVEALLEDLASRRVDHLVVTGDVTSLAFRAELRELGRMLERAGFDPERASVIPGNHDAYTRKAERKRICLAELGRFATCDLHRGMPGFPFVRLRGPLALIGLDTAIARPTFLANGAVGRAQLEMLDGLLRRREVRDRFVVVLMHHPPVAYQRVAKELQAGLLDREQLVTTLRDGLKGRAALVLAGHWHRRSRFRIIEDGPVDVLVAPSASHHGGGPVRLGGYHLLDFDDDAPGEGPRFVRHFAFDPERGGVREIAAPKTRSVSSP